MIEPVELKIPSSDGRSILHVMHWRPVGQPRAVLQIAHGMTEHVGRYGEFAAALAEQGIAVIGHDHLGHGKTAGCEEKLGFFAEKNGAIFLVQDIHRVHVRAVKLYPEIPKFILGHSMGSFLVRRYLTKYGWEEDGAILMGTGDYPAGVLLLALAAVNGTALVRGDRCRSRLLHHLVLGNYNRRIPGAKTPDDWLSRDEEKVNQFVEDPLCQFRFTCSAYRDFFRVMLDLKKKRWVKKMPASVCWGTALWLSAIPCVPTACPKGNPLI